MNALLRVEPTRRWGGETPLERFFGKFTVLENGCWLWNGGKDKNGYGKYSVGWVGLMAHCFAYDALRGDIPEGMTCDHLCKNEGCVNPWHLELVTMRINLLRGDTFQARNAAKTHCPKGHPYSGENLFTRKDGSRCCRICMRQNLRNSRERRKGA